jgi:hypothetical protein
LDGIYDNEGILEIGVSELEKFIRSYGFCPFTRDYDTYIKLCKVTSGVRIPRALWMIAMLRFVEMNDIDSCIIFLNNYELREIIKEDDLIPAILSCIKAEELGEEMLKIPWIREIVVETYTDILRNYSIRENIHGRLDGALGCDRVGNDH